MLICHVSDTHSFFPTIPAEAELIVHSGDLCPNLTRGNREIEVPYQTEWLREKAATFKDWIGNRPFLFTRGNHDFVPNLCEILQEYEINAIDLTSRKVTVAGIRFYGFPFIPFIDGEWNGECTSEQMSREVNHLKIQLIDGLDVLVAHAPPYGILDADFVIRTENQEIVPAWANRFGNRQLTNLFSYDLEDRYFPKYLLCGHVHESYGRAEFFGMQVSNAATRVHLMDIELLPESQRFLF